jgi:hypothetical protein
MIYHRCRARVQSVGGREGDHSMPVQQVLLLHTLDWHCRLEQMPMDVSDLVLGMLGAG